MARASNQLTARAVANLKEPGAHADGAGLYLIVRESGSKDWQFWHKVAGRRAKTGLGPFPAVSLADARDKAAALRGRRAEGDDIRPAAEVPRTPTFAEIAEDVLSRKVFKSAVHQRQWERALRELAKPLEAKPVDAITRQDVVAVLLPHWQRVPETAQKLRACIEKVMARATALDLRTGNNPAAWKDGLKELLEPQDTTARGHFDSMPYRDVPAFMGRLQAVQALAGRALEFAILTAARSGEVTGADWSEIDLDNALWSIPKERMKAKRDHVVPLSPPALAILKALPHREGYVFPNDKGGRYSQMAMSMALRRAVRPKGVPAIKVKPGFTVHGFRSSFRVWCAETGKSRELAELCLAHVIGNAVEQAYNRTTLIEMRREVMNGWAAHVASVIAPPPPARWVENESGFIVPVGTVN